MSPIYNLLPMCLFKKVEFEIEHFRIELAVKS